MSFAQIIVLILILIITPAGLGMGIYALGKNYSIKPGLLYLYGLMCEFTLFQAVVIPWIIRANRDVSVLADCMGQIQNHYLYSLIVCFVLGVGLFVVRQIVSKKKFFFEKIAMTKIEWILWIVFAVILLVQLFFSMIKRFEDGDDAYFLSEAAISTVTNTLYTMDPYTLGWTGLDARHALSPFPIWIAWISRMSGVNSSTFAHVVMPLVIIPLTYAIYGMIGKELIEKKVYLPLFMIFIELIVAFGNYSEFSKENFLVVRNWQGKSVYANVIISAVFLMLILISKRMEKKANSWDLFIPLVLIGASATLLSVQGAVINMALVGFGYVALSLVHKNFAKALPLLGIFVPDMVFLGLYVLLR